MSDVKHTAGIWQFSKRGQRVYGGALRDVQVAQVRLDSAEWEANGLLIAAAPDLYRELRMHVRNCPVCKGEGKAVDVFDMLTSDGPHEKTDCKRCSGGRAVLAKASGETP